MRKVKNLLLIILVIILFLYHGYVVRAERNQEARLYGEYKNGEISEEEYKKDKGKITYFSTFFNLKETLRAFD